MDLQTMITLICAVFASQGFWAWLQSRSERKSALTRLVMGLGYAKIMDLGEKYVNRGNVTKDEYQDFVKYLYEPYRDLKGDGTAEKMMDEVKKLPLRKEEA